jgi:hypothetical protein
MVIDPELLTVAVVDVEVEEATETPPLVSHCLNLYPLGIVPVESEYEPAVTLVEPP